MFEKSLAFFKIPYCWPSVEGILTCFIKKLISIDFLKNVVKIEHSLSHLPLVQEGINFPIVV